MLVTRDLLLQGNKHFITIIWTQSCLLLSDDVCLKEIATTVYLSTVCGLIIVYTDHNPLTFLNRMHGKNKIIMRWSLILQPFHLQIKHIRGKDNLIADALSRL